MHASGFQSAFDLLQNAKVPGPINKTYLHVRIRVAFCGIQTSLAARVGEQRWKEVETGILNLTDSDARYTFHVFATATLREHYTIAIRHKLVASR